MLLLAITGFFTFCCYTFFLAGESFLYGESCDVFIAVLNFLESKFSVLLILVLEMIPSTAEFRLYLLEKWLSLLKDLV